MHRVNVLVLTQKVDANDTILGFFCGWLNELAKKIGKIYVIALEARSADLADNIELYSLGKEDGSNRLSRFIKFNHFMTRIILTRKADIIFVHMCPEYAFLAFPYAKFAGIPIVMWYAHGHSGSKLKVAHRLVDRVITSSEDGFRFKSNKTVIAGQGIDVDKFKERRAKSKEQRAKKTILSVGRISLIKDYRTLIMAADILVNKKNIRDLEFRIIGDIPSEAEMGYFNRLKNIVHELRLEEHLKFIGPIVYREIHEYYEDCDLFVSASNTGSLDKAVLEAMASGKIVLTCNEAFEGMLNNYCGGRLIFEKGDAVGLSERIDSLLRLDEESKNELGFRLRNVVLQNHNLDKLIGRLVIIFQGLVRDNKGIKK